MTLDFFNSNADQIFIVGYKEKGYTITLYTDEDMMLSYDELKRFAKQILAALEKEASIGKGGKHWKRRQALEKEASIGNL